ncbi:hypothetical protein GCM10022407_20270 [Hymenobacter antarcticus]|uniref:Lycopene cyclase domain-containing protein n=1 Tax=Hymenobacter antarcticus TaxID=486270 RepID=A0ABP7Q1D3_9BACT
MTLIFAVYTICFLVGTYTHTAGLARRGFLAFPVPLAIGVFWDALTLLDPPGRCAAVVAPQGWHPVGAGHYGG